MSDTSVLLWINHLSGHFRALDEFFKGFSNDYFALVVCMLIAIWIWFAGQDAAERERNQKTVFITMISVGMASAAMGIINAVQHSHPSILVSGNFNFSSWQYFRVRPFNALPGQVNLVYYPPIDSSFPSNFAAVIFAFAFPLLVRYRKFGWWTLAVAVIGSFGRVYMGVHYPLDVIGGMGVGLVGCALAFGIAWALKWFMDLLLKILHFLSLA
jgi:undecaprenyl-diphosphatase